MTYVTQSDQSPVSSPDAEVDKKRKVQFQDKVEEERVQQNEKYFQLHITLSSDDYKNNYTKIFLEKPTKNYNKCVGQAIKWVTDELSDDIENLNEEQKSTLEIYFDKLDFDELDLKAEFKEDKVCLDVLHRCTSKGGFLAETWNYNIIEWATGGGRFELKICT